MSGKERNIYRALSIMMFSVSLGFCLVNPFLPIYVKNIGAGGLSIALIFSGYSMAKILFPPLLGVWSDLKGRRVFIFAGLGIYTLVSLGYLFMPDRLASLILLRFFQGIGAALVLPLARAFVGNLTPQNRAGSVMGTFEISFYSALAAGPLLGGLIKDRFGFPGIFGALFILCLFSLMIAVLAFADFPNSGKPIPETRVDYRRAVQSRTLQGLLFFILTRACGIILFAVFLPIVMNNTLKLSNIQIGAVMACGPALTALLLRPMGQLSDQWDRKFLVLIGGGAAALLTFFLPWADCFWQLLMLSAGIGFCSALSLPASSALLVEEGSRYGMGLTVGFFNSVMESGFLIAPFLGGLLMDAFGSNFVFYAAGAAGTLGIGVFSVLCPPVQVFKRVSFTG